MGAIILFSATDKDYERDRMAHLIAEITSGVKNAIPVKDDFDNADKVLDFIEGVLTN